MKHDQHWEISVTWIFLSQCAEARLSKKKVSSKFPSKSIFFYTPIDLLQGQNQVYYDTYYFAIVKKEPTVERASIDPVWHLLLQSKVNKKCMY